MKSFNEKKRNVFFSSLFCVGSIKGTVPALTLYKDIHICETVEVSSRENDSVTESGGGGSVTMSWTPAPSRTHTQLRLHTRGEKQTQKSLCPIGFFKWLSQTSEATCIFSSEFCQQWWFDAKVNNTSELWVICGLELQTVCNFKKFVCLLVEKLTSHHPSALH